jgi:hypothetical protein
LRRRRNDNVLGMERGGVMGLRRRRRRRLRRRLRRRRRRKRSKRDLIWEK